MRNHRHRRWVVALIAALATCGAFGAAPVQAQSVPVIVPPISAIVVGIPPAMPALVGILDDSGVNGQGGLIWSTSGRASVDVDVDINRQPGQAASG